MSFSLLAACSCGNGNRFIPLFKMPNVMKEKDLLQLGAQYQTRSHDKKCKSSQNVITPKLLFQMKNSSAEALQPFSLITRLA